MSSRETTFYVQVEADVRTNYSGEYVRSIKAVNLTQKRPTQPRPGAVMVKLTLRMPHEAFLPLSPEAVIEIPASLTERIVEVEAIEP